MAKKTPAGEKSADTPEKKKTAHHEKQSGEIPNSKESNSKETNSDTPENTENPENKETAEPAGTGNGKDGSPQAPGSAEQIAALEKELAELKEQHLRLAAEYDNYRKRTAKERDQLFSLSKVTTLEKMLPVYDNIALAVKQPTSDEQYKQGVLMIAKQFDDVLAKLGVTEVPAERGDKFDPMLHNAVMHVEDDTLDENRIAEVFQKGFALDDKVIRHAVVKVAN